jgi:hypothetical protein
MRRKNIEKAWVFSVLERLDLRPFVLFLWGPLLRFLA